MITPDWRIDEAQKNMCFKRLKYDVTNKETCSYIRKLFDCAPVDVKEEIKERGDNGFYYGMNAIYEQTPNVTKCDRIYRRFLEYLIKSNVATHGKFGKRDELP